MCAAEYIGQNEGPWSSGGAEPESRSIERLRQLLRRRSGLGSNDGRRKNVSGPTNRLDDFDSIALKLTAQL